MVGTLKQISLDSQQAEYKFGRYSTITVRFIVKTNIKNGKCIPWLEEMVRAIMESWSHFREVRIDKVVS